MKKGNILKTLVVAFLSLLLVACGSGTEEKSESSTSSSSEKSGETITFRTSSGVSEQHFWHAGFYQHLMDHIEKETNGEISFEVFTSGELVALGGEYDALREGTIDIALTFMAGYDPHRFPYTEVTMLPILESDAKIAAKAFQNLMKSDREIKDGKTYVELEFGDKGIFVIPTPPTEAYVMSTTGKRLESVSDFSNSIRLRSPTRVHELLAENLGITPTTMSISDAYDALSRNALDGLFYNIPDWKSYGFDEVLKYTIEGVNFGHFVSHIGMNQETWDSIPEEYQQMILDAADEFIFDGAELALSDTQEMTDSYLSHGGEFVKFEDLDPEVQKHISDAVVKTWYDWIDNLEEQGHAGKEMAILWRDMLVEAGAKLPQEILDLE